MKLAFISSEQLYKNEIDCVLTNETNLINNTEISGKLRFFIDHKGL